ncbi:DNA repair protein RadA [bacterium]|nr:DNA repair protein RadA [bacterium]
MAKTKTKWICQECGYETGKYLGKCPECGSWGSITEEIQVADVRNKSVDFDVKPTALSKIEFENEIRESTKISEFDRVLGGGLVKGSIILLAGDPGIGKSTLILQVSNSLCENEKNVLYVSAEESVNQIKLRSQRLGITSDKLFIYPQTNLEAIKATIKTFSPDTIIIDSIQSIYSNEVQSTAGSVSQIRECCISLMKIAKTTGTTIIIIGHVTKDGNIAGPKILEHMVDTVIYFEGDKYKSYRILRAVKNRFGNTSEVGIFDMHATGLVEVKNPSEMFLTEHANQSGSVIIVTSEGTRPLLLEIQALVGTTPYPSPRRIANGLDTGRLLQILAVLEKRVGLNLSKQDVYVNVIGGIDISETAADLGIALAVITCSKDAVVDEKTVIVGEVGLSGEIRAVVNLEKRIIEAQTLGFKKIIVPEANKEITGKFDIEVVKVKRLIDAISACVHV